MLLLGRVKIYLLFVVRKNKSSAFRDVILMGLGSFEMKEKEQLLYKQNDYLKRLICVSAWLTVLKNCLVFLRSSFSIDWLLTFNRLNINNTKYSIVYNDIPQHTVMYSTCFRRFGCF